MRGRGLVTEWMAIGFLWGSKEGMLSVHVTVPSYDAERKRLDSWEGLCYSMDSAEYFQVYISFTGICHYDNKSRPHHPSATHPNPQRSQ